MLICIEIVFQGAAEGGQSLSLSSEAIVKAEEP